MTSLSDDKIKLLEKLWFVYGNHGRYSTLPNHKFIQNILTANEDYRDFYKPSNDCIEAVDNIILSNCPRKKVSSKGLVNVAGTIIRILDDADTVAVLYQTHGREVDIKNVYCPPLMDPVRWEIKRPQGQRSADDENRYI